MCPFSQPGAHGFPSEPVAVELGNAAVKVNDENLRPQDEELPEGNSFRAGPGLSPLV